jgi:8-amino-7-oxononanoate synthase
MYDSNIINKEIEQIKNKSLERSLKKFFSVGGIIKNSNMRILNFSCNDYLNLATNKNIIKEAIEHTKNFGCSATASRLVSGNIFTYEILEKSIAELVDKEDAIVFGSGFLTNLGIINAIAGRKDEIYADKLNHASLIDGMQLSGAKCFRYQHKDVIHLEKLLKNSKNNGKKIIISDSIFSMDGDIAPVKELVTLSEKYNAMLILDEAHAVGVFGNGGGIAKVLGLSEKIDIILGTFSKSFGSYGGFAACSKSLKKFFINKARSFIYTTGLPPAALGASIATIKLVKQNDNIGLKLLHKAALFHKCLCENGINMPNFESQIIPINIGDNKKTLAVSKMLQEKYNILAVAIRPPTVPHGTSRLRLSITLAHTKNDLNRAAIDISTCIRENQESDK